MKLILLVGKSHTGKTTTLNYLYDEMCSKHARVVVPKTSLSGHEEDFECILEWTQGSRKVKVGIFTMGDYYRKCITAAREYSNKVDVLVLAYSDKFSSGYPNIVEPYLNHIIPKTVASTPLAQNDSNYKDVSRIISKLVD